MATIQQTRRNMHELPIDRLPIVNCWEGPSEWELDSSDMNTESTERPLRHGCDDLWSWSLWEKSPEVKLYGSYLRIAHFHPNWSNGTAGVMGTRILNNGRYFWELEISRRLFGTSMMMGIGTKKTRLHAGGFINILGEDNNSWGLSHKGLLWHGGRSYFYTKPFRENRRTIIGVLFDGIAGTLTYYKDGKCLGVAFRGLNEIEEPLYPAVSSTAAKTEMSLVTMKRDFVNLQDRCRDVIVKRIKDKKHLKQLYVPPKIRHYLSESILEESQSLQLVIENGLSTV
ncbi:SPRY domain-containing SOCS box protein 3 [Agrilus planipennis]|uniref:SPRY domain-containing SOCS box protein 3 n=1 Tax=Agrilus planipennis TaxID=224129 RepID=A0A1W4WGI4_AGRPL|nr:SPRY domain-containing SOCS box protein 3 [Agrilus planipennis]